MCVRIGALPSEDFMTTINQFIIASIFIHTERHASHYPCDAIADQPFKDLTHCILTPNFTFETLDSCLQVRQLIFGRQFQ